MVRNALKAAIGCLFVVVLLAETAIAQSTLIEGVPPQAELSERLAVIESLETEPTADQQRDQAALTAALQAYERLQAIEERQQALEQRVSQAPEQLLRLERELNAAQEESLQLSVDNLSDMPLEALEAELADAVIELQQLQSQMAEVNSQLLAAQTLPERAQQAISEALQRAETLRREHDTRAALLADRQLSAREDAQLIQWRLERAVAEQEVTGLVRSYEPPAPAPPRQKRADVFSSYWTSARTVRPYCANIEMR